MNGETSVLVEQRTNVLAVPNDAVRNPREAAATAPMLGLNPDTVRALIATQMAARRWRAVVRAQGGERLMPRRAPARGADVAQGDVALSRSRARRAAGRRRSGRIPDARRHRHGVRGRHRGDCEEAGRDRRSSTRCASR